MSPFVVVKFYVWRAILLVGMTGFTALDAEDDLTMILFFNCTSQFKQMMTS